ncbi:hypothetical protein BC628DRAFT_1368658 [Trametes gibbosa]|nr:hypothetical protein BC628DRAFT_1368658 [Trametes gibbosa]
MFASAAILLLAAASPAFANLFITSPVASTTWTAGQQATISWQDDGKSPSLADLGSCKVSLYVGSQTQQTLVQQVVTDVNVGTTNSIVFTPDASVGENGPYYFIRVDSNVAKDATNPANPAQAFSAKFTMAGMTGTFDATVKAEIGAAAAGASDASSASAAPGTSASATASSTPASSKGASTSSHAPSSTASAKANNGAASLAGSAFACIAGVAVAFTMLF